MSLVIGWICVFFQVPTPRVPNFVDVEYLKFILEWKIWKIILDFETKNSVSMADFSYFRSRKKVIKGNLAIEWLTSLYCSRSLLTNKGNQQFWSNVIWIIDIKYGMIFRARAQTEKISSALAFLLLHNYWGWFPPKNNGSRLIFYVLYT